jgi:hypothetical protein
MIRGYVLDIERRLGGLRGVSQMRRIVADIRHLVRNDWMVLGIHCDLHVVADAISR